MPDAAAGTGGDGRSLPHTGAYQAELGYEILRLPDGRPAARLEVAERHLNQFAIAHGGVALALLDVGGGLAVWDLRPGLARMATVSMNTAFLDAVRPGTVYALGRVERAGGTLAYTQMTLHAETPDGPLLASAQGVYRLFPERPAAAPPGTAAAAESR